MLNDRIIKNSNRNYFKSNCYLRLLNKFPSRLQSTDSCMPKRSVGSTHEESRPLVVTECILAAGVCYYMTIFLEILFMSIICKVKLN